MLVRKLLFLPAFLLVVDALTLMNPAAVAAGETDVDMDEYQSALLFGQKPPPAAPEPFCYNGIPAPLLTADEVVGVRFIEAPLLSIQYGPIPGDLLHAYHSALLFEIPSLNKNFTLEYDSMYGFGSGTFPVLHPNGTTGEVEWKNAARYCFTEGILHGKKHWSVRYTELGSMGGLSFNDLFATFVPKNNQTQEYELLRVINKQNDVLVGDNTCGNGVQNVLLHMLSTYQFIVPKATAAQMKISSFTLHAESVQKVDESDPAVWKDIYAFYNEADNAFSKNASFTQRMHDLIEIWKGHGYAYKYGTYYKIIGMHLPYITIDRLPVFSSSNNEDDSSSSSLLEKAKEGVERYFFNSHVLH